MFSRIYELAQKIAVLDPLKQEAVLEKVAELNFQHGLEGLLKRYRQQLGEKGKLEQKAAKILVELKQIREKPVADEY